MQILPGSVPSHQSDFSCSCSCLSFAIMSVAGRSSHSNKAPSQAPLPPPDYSFPPNFRPKRCVRCGAWSTQQAPYEQGNSPEKAWGILIAWEAGTVLNPQGRHCLLCRKARSLQVENIEFCGGKWHLIQLPTSNFSRFTVSLFTFNFHHFHFHLTYFFSASFH